MTFGLFSMKSLLQSSSSSKIKFVIEKGLNHTYLLSKIMQQESILPNENNFATEWRERERERGGRSIVLLPFYQVCCTQEAFNPAARCTHANHRVLPFINKTESSFLGCLASQKNFEQIGWPVSRFFASRFEIRKKFELRIEQKFA